MRVLLAAFLCLLLPLAALADPTVPQVMGQAQRAYIAHDFDTATQLFSEVLQIDPQNTLAIQYLRNIRLQQATGPAPPKDAIQSLILPGINFNKASFSAALDFFKAEAAKQSVTVSFVSELPEAQMEHTVTLSLSHIPFLDGLRYLCQLNNATFTEQPYAIVISPAAADSAPAPAAQ